VRRFTRAATHSTVTLLAPFAAGACSLFSSPVGKEGPSPAREGGQCPRGVSGEAALRARAQ